MEDLIIKGHDFIPNVRFDVLTHEMEISGMSMHESSLEFYSPIHEWLANYVATYSDKMVFNFRMEYFNTATSKEFYTLLSVLKKFRGELEVNWFYQEDDDQMLDDGEDLSEDTEVNMNFISYE